MKLYRYIIPALIVFLCLNCFVRAQNISKSKNDENQVFIGNCEQNDFALNYLHSSASNNELIIAIARLGEGETQNKLNWRRLHNVKVYLTEYSFNRDPKTLILAQGERAKGYGRIEFYLDGRLVDVMGIKQNQDLLIGSCEPDDIRPVKAETIFYPYLDKKKLLRKRSQKKSKR